MKTIADKYRVIRKLGEGFGGQVYLAETDGQQVALKQLVMEQTVLTPEENLANFRSEFTVLSKLSHPHIVRILDFGYDTKENIYYFTTEYIEGSNIFQATRPLNPQEIEELFVQTLRALSYLHSQRVYHLDIKPQNILVTQDQGKSVAKLIDFGLTAFQAKGVLAGSPSYLAPEALAGESRDGRSDLYALGVTWYECLADSNPFEAQERQKIFELQRLWNPPPVSKSSNQVPVYLDPILEKLLRKNPAERYHRADQVIRDLNWIGAKHYPLETEATALAYLPGEGRLVGREQEWNEIVSLIDRVFVTKSERTVICIITGNHGTGKTRLLREMKYYAQLHTIPVHEFRTITPAELKNDGLLIADNVTQEMLDSIRQSAWQLRPSSVMLVLSGERLLERSGVESKIVLKNFGRSSVARYTASVLGIDNPPESLVDELFARTEGNPLFLTELLRSLITSQQIFDDQGRWSSNMLQTLDIDFKKLTIPRNLSDYCRAKFDPLPQESKQILSFLSLARSPLNRSQLFKISLGTEKSSFEILQDENIISVDPTAGDLKLLNPSFRDWVSANISTDEQTKIHQSLGEIFQADPTTLSASLFHLGFGTSPAEERFQYRMRYGELLHDQNRWSEAAQAFDTASSIAPTVEKKMQGLFRKALSLFRTGNHTDSLKVLEDAQSILKKEKEDPERWRWVQQTYREMGSIYLKMRKLDLARETVQSSRVLLEEHKDDPVEEMILTNLKASIFLMEGKTPEALTIFEETQKQWESMPSEEKKEVRNNELASVYLLTGRAEEAKKICQAQANYYREIDHSAKEAYALYGWAESCVALMQFDEAVPVYESCLQLSRKLKNEELMFHVFNGLGNVAHWRKQWTAAADSYQKALEFAQHVGDFDGSIGIAINLATIFRVQGDQARCLLYLKQILETLEEKTSLSLSQLQFLTQAYLEEAEIFSESHQWIDAYAFYRDALRMIRRYPTLKRFRKRTTLGLAHVDASVGKKDEARMLLADLEHETLLEQEQAIVDSVRQLLDSSKN